MHRLTPPRLLCLPVRRCDGCGDAVVYAMLEAVCPPCQRRAELRRRLMQPGVIEARRARIRGRAAR